MMQINQYCYICSCNYAILTLISPVMSLILIKVRNSMFVLFKSFLIVSIGFFEYKKSLTHTSLSLGVNFKHQSIKLMKLILILKFRIKQIRCILQKILGFVIIFSYYYSNIYMLHHYKWLSMVTLIRSGCRWFPTITLA